MVSLMRSSAARSGSPLAAFHDPPSFYTGLLAGAAVVFARTTRPVGGPSTTPNLRQSAHLG
jgi:hypothetical protein